METPRAVDREEMKARCRREIAAARTMIESGADRNTTGTPLEELLLWFSDWSYTLRQLEAESDA